MTRALLIPMHLDALRLKNTRSVRDAVADFSRMPYFNGQRDVNGDVAHVSESIAADPFENPNLHLPPGVHLHWALPDGLIQGDHTDEGTRFETVPNRWLITRLAADPDKTVQKQWVVESDYLHPEDSKSHAVIVPHQPNPSKGEYACYRHLGRQLLLEVWKGVGNNGEYVPRLTALGFEPDTVERSSLRENEPTTDVESTISIGWEQSGQGIVYREPSFAAYYPNCYSVFGAYDSIKAGEAQIDLTGITYEVVGWYSDINQDPIYTIFNQAITEEEKREQIQESLSWYVPAGSPLPQQTLCFARLTFGTNENSEHPALEGHAATISLANTSVEALSAHLAQAIDAKNRSNIEEHLEVLHLTDRLQARELDLTPRIREARHEDSFEAINSGISWVVHKDALPLAQGDNNAAIEAERQKIAVPDSIYDLLDALNDLQRQYDRLSEEIQSLAERTFTDWYKYMFTVYRPMESRNEVPDIDLISHFLDTQDLEPLEEAKAKRGNLERKLYFDPSQLKDDQERYSLKVSSNSTSNSLAAQIIAQANAVNEAIGRFMEDVEAETAKLDFSLQALPTARHWEAKEPVVMIESDAGVPTIRHGHDGDHRLDGLLNGEIRDFSAESVKDLISSSYEALKSTINALEQGGYWTDEFPFKTWQHLPWNPLLLDWRAQVFPVRTKTNVRQEKRQFDTDFIDANYKLETHTTDLYAKEAREPLAQAASMYSGSAILTPTTADYFRKTLDTYLREHVLEDYCDSQGDSCEGSSSPAFIEENIGEIRQWYENEHDLANATDEEKAEDPVYSALRACERLKGQNCLSQALGGFNDALVMQKLTMQAPIDDPVTFPEYAPLTQRVAAALGWNTRKAPLPLNDFTPLRTGAVRLRALRLVDSFGRTWDLNTQPFVTPTRMVDSLNPSLCHLPPRITQPARIQFRWLAAEHGDDEMTYDPRSNPICGWFLVNNYGARLMIYDTAGNALGSLVEGPDDVVIWRSAPGRKTIEVEDIPNVHLKHLVEHLVGHLNGKSPGFLNHFLDTLNSALDNIAPEGAGGTNSLSLLVGRPMVVVRSLVDLQLMGLPAVHLGWNALHQDFNRAYRQTDGFTDVQMPIRIGEHEQLNDGLVGYWLENQNEQFEEDTFYSLQADSDDYIEGEVTLIKTLKNKTELNIRRTIADPPQLMTMLFDPRAKVHATTGVLPTKQIDIPPELYQSALESMYVTFLTTPLLTDRGRLRVPLPYEPGFSWSWVEKANRTQEGQQESWVEYPVVRILNKAVFIQHFEAGDEELDGEAAWTTLNSEEVLWLTPRPDNGETAKEIWSRILPKEERGSLPENMLEQEKHIQTIFDLYYQGIGPATTTADFTGPQQLREGWLKLSQAER